MPLFDALKATTASATVVGKHAVIMNSLLGNGAKVDGIVENSVVFNGVSVGKNSRIRNSVVLPFNEIEEEVVIENSLVLGGSNRVIARRSVIGGYNYAKNIHFPDIMKKGLTILGENINVPSGSRIGAGCLVQGVLERSSAPLIVADGNVMTLRGDRSPA
jgi:glucose-1-phosphate adenylyltransferase